MTGYGRGTAAGATHEVVIELSSVNRKTLDITVSSPREYPAAERWVVEGLRGKIDRGKVHASVSIRRGGAVAGPDWDLAAVRAALVKLRTLAEEENVPFKPDGRLLAQLALGLRGTTTPETEAEVEPLVASALAQALEALQAMRATEGAALAADLRHRLGLIAGWVGECRALVPAAAAAHRQALFERLQQAGLSVDLNDERVLKELALWADRADTTEELVRLDSHREQILRLLDEPGPIGRRLEFLLQEVQREVSTLGAKAGSLDITQRVLACKLEVEKLREQAANVE